MPIFHVSSGSSLILHVSEIIWYVFLFEDCSFFPREVIQDAQGHSDSISACPYKSPREDKLSLSFAQTVAS